jgi:ubiquinone/menaquinone biosynthesis C-methylase UbiE
MNVENPSVLERSCMLDLICSKCKGKLAEDGSVLRCSVCGKGWTIEGGVPVFTESSTWYPKEHMTMKQFQEFLENIESKGWDRAIGIALETMEKPEGFQALAFDEARRDLSSLLPVSSDSVVLDYGCGVGGISFGLARSCKRVFAVDQSLLRTRFIHERCKSTGVKNITAICTGNSQHLPFPEESFDIVVLSGVLEWMPLSMEGNPREIQTRALREINRVIKTGGVLYVAIENRFGYRYVILRKGDSHNQKKRKLPYITTLPRFLADLYSRVAIGHPYRCYLYSYLGYKRMLLKARFSKCDFYFPYPDHNKLNYVVPLKDRKAASLSLRHILDNTPLSRRERWALRLIERTGLLKYLAQDYSIIATK